MIVIVDYGVGNLGSMANMLKRSGVEAVVSSDHATIRAAAKLILPGVGAFDVGMKNLVARGHVPVLEERVLRAGVPILGVCLGMQLFSRGSEEGGAPGLGWIAADAVRFRFDGSSADPRLRVPHMGWNTLDVREAHPLLADLGDGARFYFVHSYHVACDDPSTALATTRYGADFASVVRRGNILGVQFHPEKSHKFGMKLLRNFAAM